MKSAGTLFIAVTLLASAGARAQDAVVPDKPYASIVARNMFGLLPIPPPVPVDTSPPEDPPPKITPNGTMTLFGKLEALFKVANKGKAGQPPKEDSYVLSEGERQEGITVLKINQPDGIITFDNHGHIQELPLIAASNTTAPAGPGGPGPGGAAAPGSGLMPGLTPRQTPMTPADRAALRGRPGAKTPNATGSAPEPNFGGNNPQQFNPQQFNNQNQQPANNIEDQVMNAAREMALIEQNRIDTQEAVDKGWAPPLPPTMLTPAGATAHDGYPLIAQPEVPLPTTRR